MTCVHSVRLNYLMLVMIGVSLVGCKIELRVSEGGSVRSADGSFVCEAGQTCIIDVTDVLFDQTFVAEPAHGYTFSRWVERDGHLCGAETTPCRLSTADFEGNPALESILESDEVFVLEPRFSWSPYCPDPGLVVSPGPGFVGD